MSSFNFNKAYAAEDVYHRWKKIVANAEESITIFAPVFDNLIRHLVAAARIGNENIIVVTRFDGSSILVHANQGAAIEILQSDGIVVCALPCLSASAILIDDKNVAFGTQVPTSAARKQKNCYCLPEQEASKSKIVQTLISWRNQATQIDSEFVCLVNKWTKKYHQEKKVLLESAANRFEGFKASYDEVERRARREHFRRLEQASKTKLESGAAFAEMRLLEEGGTFLPYHSLVVSDESDLTRWVKVDNDETRRAVELDRLCMYPILLSDNLSMGFARVGKTRITYIRDAVTWVGRNLKIDDLVIRAEITFPRKNVKDRNIIVRFREKGLSCDADLLFTGDNLICTRKTYNLKQSSNTDSADKFRRKVEKNILDSPERLKAFYAKFMVNFKYKSLGRESKNIRHYLKGNSYRISIIEFADIPILSLEKWS